MGYSWARCCYIVLLHTHKQCVFRFSDAIDNILPLLLKSCRNCVNQQSQCRKIPKLCHCFSRDSVFQIFPLKNRVEDLTWRLIFDLYRFERTLSSLNTLNTVPRFASLLKNKPPSWLSIHIRGKDDPTLTGEFSHNK